MPRLAAAVFWLSAALLAWTQALYGPFLALLRRVGAARRPTAPASAAQPHVSLIVAAYREEEVIEAKVRNALALDWPRERLELIVAVDGGAGPEADGTAARAHAAGADQVLELPRGGKVRAQDAGVRAARGDLLAFSDANATWEPDALARLAAAFADPAVGYACGQVRFVSDSGTNQEGVYWRYELWLRAHESALASVTAGNGAIYAVRREAYVEVDPVMGHDLSFPFLMVKRGRRAVYVPEARATEKMVPTIEGEWRRKRRMMSHAWPIVLRGGLLSPRGYGPLYGLMIVSHRVLRYARRRCTCSRSPARCRSRGGPSTARPSRPTRRCWRRRWRAVAVRWRPLLLARYYVLTTAALAAGLYDHLRHGTPAGWDAPEGTR